MTAHRRNKLVPLLLTVATVGLGACGSESNDAASTDVATAPADEATTTAAGADVITTTAAPATGEVITVRLGMQPWIGYGPWYIAEEMGFDTARGLDLKLISFDTDADLAAAFVAGQLEASNTATHALAAQIASGQPRTAVLFEDVSTTADAIIVGPGIESVADLAGKKVAYEEGSTSDILLRYALSTVGLTIDDVEAVPTPASNAGGALASGGVDAAVTYEPYISALLGTDDQLKLLFSAGEKPGLISDVWTVNSDWAAANPEVVKNALLVWDDAVKYYNEYTDEGREIIAKAVGSTLEDLATSFDGVQLYTLAESNAYLAGDFAATAAEIEKILNATGQVTDADIASAVDPSFGVSAEAAE